MELTEKRAEEQQLMFPEKKGGGTKSLEAGISLHEESHSDFEDRREYITVGQYR